MGTSSQVSLPVQLKKKNQNATRGFYFDSLHRCVIFLLFFWLIDEYKKKGVEKLKYISGDQGGVESQDSTVSGSAQLLL